MATYLLVVRYRRTGNSAYLWFIGALVVCPIINSIWVIIQQYYIRLLTDGVAVKMFPFSLVSRGVLTMGELLAILQYSYQLVYGLLILAAIVKLDSGKWSAGT